MAAEGLDSQGATSRRSAAIRPRRRLLPDDETSDQLLGHVSQIEWRIGMINATEARAQSERTAKMLADRIRRGKDIALANDRLGSAEGMKNYVIGCLTERIQGAITEGKTVAFEWWPCNEHAMWMGVMQDIMPFFLARGYKVVGLRSRTDNRVARFDITVSW